MRIAAAAGILLIATAAASGQTDEARKRISAAYNAESAALAKEDVSGVLVHYHRDFLYTGPNNQRFRLPQIHAILASMFQNLDKIRNTASVVKLTMERNTARVTVTERLDAILAGARPPARGALRIVENRVDEWVPSGKTWVKKSSRVTSRKQTLDGKPYPPTP